jgi:ATP-dependent DNA ligase
MNTPMLLQKFHPGCRAWPYWVERKYDGVRCFIVVDGSSVWACARSGNRLWAGERAAREIWERARPGVYDGELVGASLPVTLSAVKRGDTRRLRFKVFDYLTIDEWATGRSDRPLMERRRALVDLIQRPGLGLDSVVDVVRGQLIRDAGALAFEAARALDRGWEGLVAKDPNAPYLCGGRSRGWLKIKSLEVFG